MTLKKKKGLTLGLDLGGTKIETALVDGQGNIVASHRNLTHPEKGPEKIFKDILICINECFRKTDEEAEALGVGLAGQVNGEGVVRSSPNLGWQDFPLRERLEKELHMPVVVINDVKAAGWGEWKYGAGRGINDLVIIFVGTGIGGSIVSGGRMLEGCTNTAGELGHTTLIVDGRRCHCPNNGCLEAYAGGWAIAERAQEAVRYDPEAGKTLISLAGAVENITAFTVTQAYQKGDSLAFRLVRETSYFLAAGLVSAVNSFNPCLLILGGGVIEGLPELIKAVDYFIKQKALKPAVEKLRVVSATLGSKAGVIGAAALAQEKIK